MHVHPHTHTHTLTHTHTQAKQSFPPSRSAWCGPRIKGRSLSQPGYLCTKGASIDFISWSLARNLAALEHLAMITTGDVNNEKYTMGLSLYMTIDSELCLCVCVCESVCVCCGCTCMYKCTGCVSLITNVRRWKFFGCPHLQWETQLISFLQTRLVLAAANFQKVLWRLSNIAANYSSDVQTIFLDMFWWYFLYRYQVCTVLILYEGTVK